MTVGVVSANADIVATRPPPVLATWPQAATRVTAQMTMKEYFMESSTLYILIEPVVRQRAEQILWQNMK
jgi:hypothetical protein